MRHERERGRMDPIPVNRNGENDAEEKGSYGPAKPFNKKKLLLQFLTIAAVALAIAIGISIFFKVDTVSISGMEKYSYESIRDASGIQEDDSLLFFSRAEVSSKIMQKLPYVKSVRIGISLPGTVHIVIEEVAVTYAIADNAGAWWLISADGKVLEQVDADKTQDLTVIQGVTLLKPEVGAQANAAPQHTDDATAVTAADRLAAALLVLQGLESNELLGEFAVVDVTSPYDLQLWYRDAYNGDEYLFKLGDSQTLVQKLSIVKGCLPRIVADYPSGMLDVSQLGMEEYPFTKFD